jgi:hypothetical protein
MEDLIPSLCAQPARNYCRKDLQKRPRLWGPSSVPHGQEPLVALSNANFSEFENAFDGDLDTPQLVLLLSPT